MSNREMIEKLFEPRFEKDSGIWEKYLNTIRGEILWYPSAGDDFRLFYHIDKDRINNLFSETPTIFYTDSYLGQVFIGGKGTDNTINYTENRKVKVRIQDAIDIQFVEMPETVSFIHKLDKGKVKRFLNPGVDLNENDDNVAGGIYKFIKPKPREEIKKVWNKLKSEGYKLNELEKPNHLIRLINFELTTPDNETSSQYVLYFFWDNIAFFELVVNQSNLPVRYIMSNRNCMDEETRGIFSSYLFENEFILKIICDNGLLDNIGGVQGNAIELSQYNTNENGYHWGVDDYVKVFEILR